jgi:hypothetical protein
MQQLILGTGTAIWWLTEPHLTISFDNVFISFQNRSVKDGIKGLRRGLACILDVPILVKI